MRDDDLKAMGEAMMRGYTPDEGDEPTMTTNTHDADTVERVAKALAVAQGIDGDFHDLHCDDQTDLMNAARAALSAMPPQAIKVKPFLFDWTHDEHSPNPTCHRLSGNGYSAYVLIPFEGPDNKGNDPESGIGTWNGVANNLGKMGFTSKADAVAYCEKTIRDFAQVSINGASNFLEVAPQGVSVQWFKGTPPHPHGDEWFIAKTKNREKVVLRSLGDGNSYDYETADGTYIVADHVVEWMQFPDSSYTPYTPDDELRMRCSITAGALHKLLEDSEYPFADFTMAKHYAKTLRALSEGEE